MEFGPSRLCHDCYQFHDVLVECSSIRNGVIFQPMTEEQRTELQRSLNREPVYGPLPVSKDEIIADLEHRVKILENFHKMACRSYPALATIPLEPLPLTEAEIMHGKEVAARITK